MRALIGTGGNLGGHAVVARRFVQVARAIAAWREVRSVRASSLRATAPFGPVRDQPPFLNGALLVELDGAATPARAQALLAQLLALEITFDRNRADVPRMGPRTLDLDLLMVDALCCDVPGPPALVLPHPRLAERAFALAPLVELVGAETLLPGGSAPLGALLALAQAHARDA